MSRVNQIEQQNDCAICLDSMDAKGGRALFTAECSHTFHFHCIVSNVQHGNHTCPLCLAVWKQLPSEPSRPPGDQHHPYSDDEPLEQQSQSAGTVAGDGKVEVGTFLEFPAIEKSRSLEDFSVLIHLKAPSLPASESERAAVDIVAVLDVSGSMAGSKLSLLKQAMSFVVQNLSSRDRLSVVTFSSNARRVFRLLRMTDSGRSQALQEVNGLTATGWTDIAAGLAMGAKVLEERRHRNPVCSIMFLSDGCDNMALSRAMAGRHPQTNSYMSLLPPSIVGGEISRRVPVHAFGFGTDHDAALMHSISEASGGTFSFVEAPQMIQDAFAQCIGGLLSVVAQEVQVEVRCSHPEIHINSMSSGRYTNQLADAGRRASIQLGNLYASEERDSLVSINLNPGPEEALLNVSCTYKEPVSKNTIHADEKEVRVPRPEEVKPEELLVSPEVDRHKKRFEAIAAVASAQAAADDGDLSEAVSILGTLRGRWSSDGPPRSAMQASLDDEMEEMQSRLGSMRKYKQCGKAYMMSSHTAHGQQRASARSRKSSTSGLQLEGHYQTDAMTRMIGLSRAHQQAQAGGSPPHNSPPSSPPEP